MQMNKPYQKLLIAILINTVIMYFLTYLTIYSLDHFYFNLNRLYMALAMASPMVVVMILMMGGMYMDRRKNLVSILAAVVIFALAVAFIRTQTPIGNDQFLRSMIPHHSGAILMCRQANISDPQIIALCGEIVKSQQDEIDQMKSLLGK